MRPARLRAPLRTGPLDVLWSHDELREADARVLVRELAATGKRAAKGLPGSSYVRDGQTIFAVTAAS